MLFTVYHLFRIQDTTSSGVTVWQSRYISEWKLMKLISFGNSVILAFVEDYIILAIFFMTPTYVKTYTGMT